jgi:hypothetical protein
LLTYSSMRRPAWALLCSATVWLAGCGTLDVPRADNYEASSQKKARAVHHWDVLADDVAQRVAGKFHETATSQAAVYVVPAPDTAFRQGFRELLMTRLLERGVRLATASEGALRLEISTQVVQHSSHPSLNTWAPATKLGLGVVVLRDLVLFNHSNLAIGASALALGAVADIAGTVRNGRAAGGPTGVEVLVSTALQDQQRYLARTADVYYIEQADASLYQQGPPSRLVKTWKVVDR